jgi:hypothetical protein
MKTYTSQLTFAQFQNYSRLYVIGALEADELEEFEAARKKFGAKGEEFINDCYALHEAFALSLKPAKSSAALKERLMSMVKEQKRRARSTDSQQNVQSKQRS